MILMKVGKREHLESLRDGNIYFSPLSRFRGDGTLFRGDQMEGKVKVDTSKGFWINGVDLSHYIEKVDMSYMRSGDILVFCAAILDDSNMQVVGNNLISIKQEFLNEMRKFGRYAVIFELDQFKNCVSEKAAEAQFYYGYGAVSYVDKDKHDDITHYFQKTQNVLGTDAIYFLKDHTYSEQHEWRFFLDCVPRESKNSDGTYVLKIAGLQVSDIIDLDSAQNLSE